MHSRPGTQNKSLQPSTLVEHYIRVAQSNALILHLKQATSSMIKSEKYICTGPPSAEAQRWWRPTRRHLCDTLWPLPSAQSRTPVLRQARHDAGARDHCVERAVEHGTAGRRLVAGVQLQVHRRKLHLPQRRAARPGARKAKQCKMSTTYNYNSQMKARVVVCRASARLSAAGDDILLSQHNRGAENSGICPMPMQVRFQLRQSMCIPRVETQCTAR